MGMIEITMRGSFPTKGVFTFSAEDGGHADAVGRAIKLLVEEVLPDAIQLDHKLHSENEHPARAFGTGTKEAT